MYSAVPNCGEGLLNESVMARNDNTEQPVKIGEIKRIKRKERKPGRKKYLLPVCRYPCGNLAERSDKTGR